MSDFEINERAFFINNGKSFKQFIREVENSKNNSCNTDLIDYLMQNTISDIRKKIDGTGKWNKLK